MIIAKQRIKTNQILSVGWSLSIGKIGEKLQTNQHSSLKRYVKCALKKWESTEWTLSEPFFYFPCDKKLKKSWGQCWVKTKLLELKHLLDQNNSPNGKPP